MTVWMIFRYLLHHVVNWSRCMTNLMYHHNKQVAALLEAGLLYLKYHKLNLPDCLSVAEVLVYPLHVTAGILAAPSGSLRFPVVLQLSPL